MKHAGSFLNKNSSWILKIFSRYIFKNFRAHYNVVLKEIEVGGAVLELPTDVFDAGDNRGTIIDSGTTLAYLPDVVYESLMNKVLAVL